jgi:hypothetical protein
MPESDAILESDWVSLTTTEDLGSARILASALESAGIEVFVRDMNMVAQAPYLGGGRGGYRVEVREKDHRDAEAILAAKPSVAEEEARLLASGFEDESMGDTAFDPVAKRALRLALFGFFLWPLLHPVSLVLGGKLAWRRDLSFGARRDARMAMFISLFSLVVFTLVLTSILRTLHQARPADGAPLVTPRGAPLGGTPG